MPKSVMVTLPGKSPVTLTAGGFCSPCEAQALTAQIQATQATWQINAEQPSADPAWEGPLVFESQMTGDGRYINDGALTWEASQFPMPLRWAPTDVGAHGGAVVIGLINSLERRSGGAVWGQGTIDGSTPEGQRVLAGLANGTIKGVSADLDDMAMEVRVKQEIIDEVNASIEAMMSGEEDDGPVDVANGEKPDENGYTKVHEAASDDEVMYVTQARMRAATLVDIPAFADAYVALVASAAGDVATPELAGHTLVAAGAPVAPPAAWFANPLLDGPTPITFTADGRIFGHIALWGTCHTGYGQCVTPPNSATNYAWFRTGALIADNGQEIPVGHVTLDTGHAGLHLQASAAAAHYDDTGVVAADVAAGEDAYGIYITGALRPDLTDVQLRELRSAPMSGDWRTVGGNLELVHVLGVNMPGFMVPRTKALVASGRTTTLLVPVPALETEIAPAGPSKVDIFAKNAQKLRLAKLAATVKGN